MIKNIRIGIPENWEVVFPLDDMTKFSICSLNSENTFGVAVRNYSKNESRFIVCGKILNENELAYCLKEAEKIASTFNSKILTTQEKVKDDLIIYEKAFQLRNFQRVNQSYQYEGPFNIFAERISRIESALIKKNSIPLNARISNLDEGLDEVRFILNKSLMMDDYEFDSRLKSTSSSQISKTYSQIAWHNEKIVGVMLVASSSINDLFDIPIRYIVPSYRQTWVNALLIASSVKHGINIGAKLIRFDANIMSHKETALLAKKTQCVKVNTFTRFEKHL